MSSLFSIGEDEMDLDDEVRLRSTNINFRAKGTFEAIISLCLRAYISSKFLISP